MGCWNGTCLLTNLPIFHGDEVYTFFLEEAAFKSSSYCYPTSMWNLVPLYFEGKYDDYGGVEECCGSTLDILVESIKYRLIEVDEGPNQFHDIPVKKDRLTIEKIIDASLKERLFVEGIELKHVAMDSGKPYVSLKHVMIHRAALQRLLALYKRKMYNIAKGKYHDQTFSDLLDMGRAYVNALLNLDDTTLRAARLLGYYTAGKAEGPAREFYRYIMNGRLRMCRVADLEGLFFEAIVLLQNGERNQAVEYLDQVVYQICVSVWIESFMMDCRRTLCPPSGEGSQNGETEAQKVISNITLELANWIDNREQQYE